MILPSPYRAEFSRVTDAICLNHSGCAPIPQRTAQVVAKWADYMTRREAFRYAELEEAFEQARIPCATLLGVTAEQIAFTRNTSEGLSYVALGLDWKTGDEIVTTDQEFPSNLVIWLEMAKRLGLKVHQVPSGADGSVSWQALLERVNQRTRVVTVSSVQFGTGAAVDLAQLGAALRHRETLLVVDAVQSLGVLPMNAPDLGVDAIAAGGHKWMLAPEGCGLFYLSEKAMAQVRPTTLGWHSVVNAGSYDTIDIRPRVGIKRFEAGTANVLGATALGQSVAMLLEVGIETVRQRVFGLVASFFYALKERGCLIHSPWVDGNQPQSGILIFSHPKMDSSQLHRELKKAAIEQVCRSKGVRFSPHFYQDHADVERTLAVLDGILPQSPSLPS